MPGLDGVAPSGGTQSLFELRTLTGLSCGCVVADFRAVTIDVELVSIEAKGPHCSLADHSCGHILAIGGRPDVDPGRLAQPLIEETAA